MQGRDIETIAVLKRIASIDLRSLDLYLSSIPLRPQAISNSNFNSYISMKGIFKRRWALQRIIATMILGFGIGVAYCRGLFFFQSTTDQIQHLSDPPEAQSPTTLVIHGRPSMGKRPKSHPPSPKVQTKRTRPSPPGYQDFSPPHEGILK
jgi:hypothetical protein